MNLNSIPKDSLVWHFLTLGKFTEIPYSYLTVICLSGISHLLGRRVVFPLGRVPQVTPNLSVILIGPAGVGKGQAMEMGKRFILRKFSPDRCVPTAPTAEGIMQHFFNVHMRTNEVPTCGWLIYGELAAGVGKKDYQQGLIECLTNILSDEDSVEHATRHDPILIQQPTLVVQAGSTKEWFHKLPEAAIEGGFLPRFLIVAEDKGRDPIALPEDEMDWDDRKKEDEALKLFNDGIHWIIENYRQPMKIHFEEEAKAVYKNWYNNRFMEFRPMVRGYAQRSRAAVARLAMLMAVSRRQKIISVQDVQFALEMLRWTMERLEDVMLPPSKEAQCIAEVKLNVPATMEELIIKLRPKFDSNLVTKVVWLLANTTKELRKANGKFENVVNLNDKEIHESSNPTS